MAIQILEKFQKQYDLKIQQTFPYGTDRIHRDSRSPIQLDTNIQARKLDRIEVEAHSQKLATCTPYNPEVFVLVVTLLRPYFLDECLKRIFQNITPLKVRLVNQGDRSDEMLDVLEKWRSILDIDYIYNEHPRSMAEIRSEAFTWAKQEGYEFVITVDDDMLVLLGALDELVKIARKNPQFHAIAGYCIEPGIVRMLGGKEKVLNGSYFHFNLPYTKGLKEVDYVSSGLRIVRLDPLILQDIDYDFGWIDWDYSKRMRQAGLRLAVTGRVGGYHGMMEVNGEWQAKPDPETYVNVRLDKDRRERMTQLFEKKWGYSVGGSKRSRLNRILSQAQLDIGTLYYKGIRLYDQNRLLGNISFTGSFKIKTKETAIHGRSKLETYVDILKALSEGAHSLKGLSKAAGVSERKLRVLLGEMSSKKIVKISDVHPNKDRKDDINYELTEKGMNVLGYFTHIRHPPPYQKA